MLVIRLKRIGRKNQAYFRVVVQEKTKAPSSSVVETLGSFNPHTDPATLNLKKERIEYWLSKGAQTSATVNNMLINEGIIKGEKMRVVQPKKKLKKGEDKKEELKKEEEKPAEEKPKEEVKEEEHESAKDEKDMKEEKKDLPAGADEAKEGEKK